MKEKEIKKSIGEKAQISLLINLQQRGKIIINIFLVLLLMNTNKIHSQVPEEYKIELLNEDSVYIMECLLINSEEKELKDKQHAILLNIVPHYIKAQQSQIQKKDGLIDGLPIVIQVIQDFCDYKGNNLYYIYWSCIKQSKPRLTHIAKTQDRYVFFEIEGKSLPDEDIPEIFLEYWQKPQKTGTTSTLIINELSWVVLMCKDSTEHIVIKNLVTIESCVRSENCAKYINDFFCTANNKLKRK